MNALLELFCCLSPFFAILLIVAPILWAKINLPPEHKKYRQQVKAIEAEYQRQLNLYNSEKRQSQANTISDLLKMHPYQFERHIAYIFQKMGYKALAKGGMYDGGIDIEARLNGEFVVIQCKRYSRHNKVGSPEVRNFIGAMTVSKADKGYFVTTSSFSQPALREARHVETLSLIDGQGIIDWWKKYRIGPYKDTTPPKRPTYPPEPAPLPPITVFRFNIWQWIALVALGEMAIIVILLFASIILIQTTTI